MQPLLFGKYCLLERISVGGMAEVFRSKPLDAPDFRGYLALKRILPHLAEDEQFIKMFVDEAKLTVQLDHPNIVRIYELGQFQSSYYILMEFISGKDVLALQKTMRRQRNIMPVDMSMFIAREMARGLHYAHHKRDADGNPLNIIHRDVSPQNVLLDYRGRVKVIDFGIAKGEQQSTRTAIGVLKGKMGYMSPEQVRGEVLDYRSDVFAIGTVLWEMLTNRRLFHAENEFETMQRVRDAVADPPSTRNELVTPRVDEIVMGALTRDPEDRYDSAAVMADTIDEWLAENPYTAEDLSVWMRTIYADDLEAEREKREKFATIITPDDVLQLQDQAIASPVAPDDDTVPGADPVTPEQVEEAAAGLGEELSEASEAWSRPEAELDVAAPDVQDGVWVGEEKPEEGQDFAEFADQHTTVQAGGFDASEAADDSVEFETLAPESGGYEAVTSPLEPPPPVEHADTPVDASIQPPETAFPTPGPSGAEVGAAPAPDPDPVAEPAHQAIAQPAVRGPGGGVGTTQHAAGPQHTASEFQSADTHAGAPRQSPPRAFYAIAALCLLLALGGIGAAAAVLLNEEEPKPTPMGEVVISVTPPDGIRIKVDGNVVGTASPHTERLPEGQHAIVVDHPEFEPFSKTVQVAAGQPTEITAALEPTTAPPGFVVLRLPDERKGLSIYVDGERREFESGKNPTFELRSGKHLFEALRDGFQPWSATVDVEPRVRREELVELTPVGLTLEIQAGSQSSVRFGKERLGRGTVSATGIDPREVHKISVSYRGQGVSNWSSYAGLPRVASGSIEVNFDKKLPDRHRRSHFGYLQVSTGDDWWEILIDDHPLGLTTPIDARGKLPVSPGKHKLSFQRGGTKHDFEIEIQRGETFLWRKKLPFEWQAPTE